MSEKFNTSINKKDLEVILEANKKAIEIESEVAEQNEEIIEALDEIKNNLADASEKEDKILKLSEDNNKDLFRIQVLFIAGLLNLIIQIVQLFIKK